MYSPALSLRLARVSNIDSGVLSLQPFFLSSTILCCTDLSHFTCTLMSVPKLIGVATLCTMVDNCALEAYQGSCGDHFMNFASLRDPGLVRSLVQCLKTIASYIFCPGLWLFMAARFVWYQSLRYGWQ